ncbi:MAG: pentapeptide repeat-containing protein, partial [candidate division Zixibacteria bacterium]
MEDQRCSYDGCKERVNSPHDDTLCVFHAPADKKGITVEEFNELIWRRINKKSSNFSGFIFPGDIYFRGECKKEGGAIGFAGDVDFSKARFPGIAYFLGVLFAGDANFSKSLFSGDARFSRAQFSGDAFFDKARFSGGAWFAAAQFSECAEFEEVQFSGDVRFFTTQFSGDTFFEKAQFSAAAFFNEAQFSGDAFFTKTQFSGNIEFSETRFSGRAYFIGARFSGKTTFSNARFSRKADFSEAQFYGKTEFDHARFDSMAMFVDLIIKIHLRFHNIFLSEKAQFFFKSPRFDPVKEDLVLVKFDIVRFNPFSVHFGDIQHPEGKNKDSENKKALLIFRYCQLKDVYFTNNDMSLFSFYKSSFDEARFISSEWSAKRDHILHRKLGFDRNNVIPEESLLDDIRDHKDDAEYIKKIKEKYEIEDLNGFEDVASLYRRMKTALDNTKDYQQASWFYFNEFEMKRKALEEEIENSLPKWKIFRWQPLLWFYRQLKKIFSKYFFYFWYKVLAGFGEKPLWSFYWFLLGILGFTTLNYCIGLK